MKKKNKNRVAVLSYKSLYFKNIELAPFCLIRKQIKS